jgi:hypothetical protein
MLNLEPENSLRVQWNEGAQKCIFIVFETKDGKWGKT